MTLNSINPKYFQEILSIEFAKYSITPINSLNSKSILVKQKEGCLLKICFKNIGVGYADFFAWEELGDLPIKKQIKYLSEGVYTEHLKRSVYFAHIDATFRAQKKYIFHNILLPKNHFTIANINELSFNRIEFEKKQGFSFFKIKCGFNLNNETILINKIASALRNLNIKLRLDFNSVLNFDALMNFLLALDKNLDVIDFIEDPFLYDTDKWREINKLYPKLNLAIDRDLRIFQTEKEQNNLYSPSVYIVKPALHSANNLANKGFNKKAARFVFTSYMDHPLGQLTAMFEASQYYVRYPEKAEDCGFLTHLLYEKNPYAEGFSISNGQLIPPLDGTGFGFDSLLASEKWRKINGN